MYDRQLISENALGINFIKSKAKSNLSSTCFGCLETKTLFTKGSKVLANQGWRKLLNSEQGPTYDAHGAPHYYMSFPKVHNISVID